MNTILSLCVHEGRFPKTVPSDVPNDKVLRAILRVGRVAKHDDDVKLVSTKLVAEFAHPNLFESLRCLKGSVKEWASRNGNCFVEGIDSLAPCWPVDLPDEPLSAETLESSTRKHIIHCGGYKGLLCFVKLLGGVHRAELHDVLPFPGRDEALGAVINCSGSRPSLKV